ncbi:MAG: efflux RND transporter periplasmic adaptor subunit [Candidatus Sumerlaeaceae bacterium]|nr:efflux RND transporter periplasmic adaptor subunit [Candidatus Sumerlaeaceae bacterium]
MNPLSSSSFLSLKPFAAIMLLALVLSGCGRNTAPPVVERPPAPVSVVAAISRNVPDYLDEIGKCVARESVSILPQVSGRITKIHFTDGADLKTSDLLFTIDPRPYEAQLNIAEAAVKQKKATLELARIEYNRISNLVDTNAAARQDFDIRKNAVQIAEAQVESSEADVQTAKLNLEYCSIRSPINGRAGQRLVDVGNVVSPTNATPLLLIQNLDPIYVDFTVTENDLTDVQHHMADKTLKVEVRLPDEPNSPRVGELTFLDNAVQAGTGTVKVRATIANADRRFWPGRFVRVRLILSTRENAVLVPADAPQMSAKGAFVYVVKPDTTADLRLVKLGQRQDDLVVVTDGLKAGEQIVTAGQLTLAPGAKTRIVDTSSTGTATTTGTSTVAAAPYDAATSDPGTVKTK